MQIETDDGRVMLSWLGPSLLTRFQPGDPVATSFPSAGFGGLVSPVWHVVRSSTATAATLDTHFYTQSSTEPGTVNGVSGPNDFPRLAFVHQGCCAEDRSLRCMFMTLNASMPGSDVVSIPMGETGTIGEWAVTPLGDYYTQGPEYVLIVRVTVLGPAPARSDGGAGDAAP